MAGREQRGHSEKGINNENKMVIKLDLVRGLYLRTNHIIPAARR